ncbi:MAG: DNA repair protein RadC [Paraprevotella sp.]|nr:DNA repair protein RadC [Paraprevotella sp.]
MSALRLNIKQQAAEDRPREKLMAKGPSALSNAELLAILIGSGTTDETAVELMQRVLADCGNSLITLGRRSLDELMSEIDVKDDVAGKVKRMKRYKGLGEAKAVTILAACELARRRSEEPTLVRKEIHSSVDLFNYFLPKMQDLPHEECYVLLMNQACKVLGHLLVSRGGLTETAVDIRMIMREALLKRATVLALCHNHPSGSLRPSADDDRLTDRLSNSCKMMGIRLLDHIIVTDSGFYSYCEEGRL